MIVLNLKTYEQGFDRILYLVDIASEVVEENGLRIVVCPPIPYLKEASERFGDIFSQHVDPLPPGAHTGSVPAKMLSFLKVKGSLINHSEDRMDHPLIQETVKSLHESGMESLICAPSVEEGSQLALFSPTYIAVEPPELIGSGKSVSDAKPEVVSGSVNRINEINNNIKVLCGAGVSNIGDVQKAIELGAEGVLLASAYVKSDDPKEFLRGLTSKF